MGEAKSMQEADVPQLNHRWTEESLEKKKKREVQKS